MADRLVIRVDGSAPQLGSFFTGVSSEVDRWVAETQRKYANLFSTGPNARGFLAGAPRMFQQLVDTQLGPVMEQWGSKVKTVGFQIDSLNNSLKATVQAGLQLRNGDFIPVQTMQRQFGNAEKYVRALNDIYVAEEKIAAAGTKRATREAQATQARDVAASRIGLLQREAGLNQQSINDAQNLLDLARIRERYLLSTRPGPTAPSVASQMWAQDYATVQNEIKMRTAQLTGATNDLVKTQNALATAYTNPAYANYDKTMRSIANSERRTVVPLQRALVDARGRELTSSTGPVETYPVGYQQLPSGVQKLLSKGRYGLNTLSPDYMVNEQKATFNTAYRDMERGLTHFSGEYQTQLKNGIPVMQKWSATVDDMGRVVQTTSRNLRGFGRIFEQIGRDFQKVLEWTVATTLIFGAIQGLGSALGIVKQLDADLTRFSVTAGLSAAQTKSFYSSLLNVAQITATPIEELVTAADDLALAIKQPGQTTKELTRDIETLAEAIGIYTNLTGQDTVSATDQLVAVMKQLGYTASGVYTVLNKVTASAGGQSGAIADITKGLAVMAEAGKQAGLSVDQQIAVIKTLSQVTSKSPAEVATAFKNLVGALENPAAIKALRELNIELISDGSNIIKIYQDIAQKIKSGEISSTEVSGLLRAISGGPRRAPDAAALLSNINMVVKETKTSQEATNEAFLANAQIMDTLNAKFTQFQNTLKDKTFQQFGKVLNDTVISAMDFISGLLNLINLLPSGFLSVMAGVGALFIGVKIGIKIIDMLRNSLVGLLPAQAAVTQATLAQVAAQQALNKTTAQGLVSRTGQPLAPTPPVPGRLAPIGGKAGLGYGLAGAGIGAVGAFMAGGGLPQILGGGLSGAGMGLLMVPEPTGLTKAAGAISLLLGTILSLQSGEKEAIQSSKELQLQLLNVKAAAQSTASSIEALNADQELITGQINKLKEKQTLKTITPEEVKSLIQLQEDYSVGLINIANANRELADSMQTLRDTLYELGFSFANQLNDIELRGSKDLQDAIDNYLQTILNITYPDRFVDGKMFALHLMGQGEGQRGQLVPSIPSRNTSDTDYLASYTQRSQQRGRGYTPVTTETIDLRDLKNNASALDSIIATMEDGNITFKLTSQNLDYVASAIAGVGNEATKLRYLKTYTDFVINNSDTAAIKDWFNAYEKGLESLRSVDATTASALQSQSQAGLQAISTVGRVDKTKGNTLAQEITDKLKIAFDTRTPVDEATIREWATYQAKYQDIAAWNKMNPEEQIGAINGVLTAWKMLSAAVTEAGLVYDNNIKIFEKFADFSSGLQEKLASQTAEAEVSRKSGDISGSRFKAIIDYSKEASEAIRSLDDEMNNLLATFNGKSIIDLAVPVSQLGLPDMTSIINDLTKINGLQDAASLTTTELISRMFGLADVYNLTGGEVDKLGGKLEGLLQALVTLSQIKTEFTWAANMDVSQIIAVFEAMNQSQKINSATGFTISSPNHLYDSILTRLKKAQTQIKTFKTSASSLYRPHPAPSSGGGSKGPGTDYGELDLPEELSGLPNRNSLISQAIANARKLQAQIPGAAAEGKNDVVTILDGMQKLETVRGIREDLLRRALEDLADIEKKRLENETKADIVRRIRVGAGDFTAIANVPVNSTTGVSMGGPNGPINVTLNLNGTVLTPAQFEDFANKIAAAIARQVTK